MELYLNGKNALVSGSTAGIGLATAKALYAEGANVIINGRTPARVDEALKILRESAPADKARGTLRGIVADLTTEEGVQTLEQLTLNLDILVNNLGAYEAKDFQATTIADWLKLININLLTGIQLTKMFMPQMINRNWGRVIFVSSETGVNVPPDMIAYGTTKAAQIALSRGLAETTKATEVTVNCVLPGPTKSEGIEIFLRSVLSDADLDSQEAENSFLKNLRPTSLIQRFALPEEVASTICYLASPVSSATNGAAIRVEGGLLRSVL